jgi:excisionase family DNA binding protein
LLALQQALDALPANGGQSGSVAVITLAGADGLTDDAAMTYSIAETADRLGVSARTVRRMIAGGRLPTVTLNRRRRIPAAALEEVGR